MTDYATRFPLQSVTNTHYAMSEQRRSTRRSSARLAEKDDTAKAEIAVFTGETPKPLRKDKTVSKASGAGTNGAAQVKRGKRKLDYDEDDDGFLFTRTKPKRTKATQGESGLGPTEEPETEPKQLQVRKSRKKTAEPGNAQENEEDDVPRRKGARTARNKLDAGEDTGNSRGKGSGKTKLQFNLDDEDNAEVKQSRERPRTPKKGGDVTKIALPFADTPVIRRNKEMRKGGGDGSRRSSLTMRGRRASSLIDSGTSNALPHAEVPASEFFKHIEGGLPEPRRMKQLLIWCATRALGDKPSFSGKNSSAYLAAYEIKQQLLNDFSTHSEMSDWFSREDRSQAAQTLRPNPRNLANQAKIKDLEQRLARLKSERETWHSLLNPSSDPQLSPLPSTHSVSSIPSTHLGASDTAALEILSSASTSVPSDPTNPPPPSQTPSTILATSVSTRTTAIASKMEFQIDKLADSAHILAQHLEHSNIVARRVLRGAAAKLDAQDRSLGGNGGGKGDGDGDGAGTRDVLRALSRVVER